jgi:hypothetical protein
MPVRFSVRLELRVQKGNGWTKEDISMLKGSGEIELRIAASYIHVGQASEGTKV